MSSTGRRPLRVLYLSWRDRDNPEAGGSETFVERTAAELTGHGDAVTIFTARFAGGAREDSHDRVRVLRRGNRFTVYPRALAHMVRHRRDYDVIVDVQNGLPFWSPLVAGVPVVNVVHHVHRDQWPVIFGPRLGALGWFLESRVAPRVYRACRYLTVSYATLDDLVQLGVDRERLDLAYSGNDLPENFERYRRLSRTSHPSLIVLGRLVPHKQVELAIDVLVDLSDEFPSATLDVVGGGYWHDELVAYADRAGVSDRVRFHGFVDETSKHTLLAQSWVSVMPSHKEGWGLTIVEAGLHGTPTVAFAHAGGPSESIVHGETGLLAQDVSDMTAQVRALVRSAAMRRAFGERAREHAASFDWATTGARLRQTLDSVLGHGPRPALPRSTHGDHRPVHEIVAEHELQRLDAAIFHEPAGRPEEAAELSA